jgi:MinD superfamily P-loop ATPase
MVRVIRELGIPGGIVINKDDEWSKHVEAYAAKNNLPILMKIPFSREIAVMYSKGMPLNLADESWDGRFYDLYLRIDEVVG